MAATFCYNSIEQWWWDGLFHSDRIGVFISLTFQSLKEKKYIYKKSYLTTIFVPLGLPSNNFRSPVKLIFKNFLMKIHLYRTIWGPTISKYIYSYNANSKGDQNSFKFIVSEGSSIFKTPPFNSCLMKTSNLNVFFF